MAERQVGTVKCCMTNDEMPVAIAEVMVLTAMLRMEVLLINVSRNRHFIICHTTLNNDTLDPIGHTVFYGLHDYCISNY